MAKSLSDQSCVPCRAGSPAVTDRVVSQFMRQLPGWRMASVAGVPRIRATFLFKDYEPALAFTQAVGKMAEHEDHHPRIVLEWGKVKVEWWTHAIGGLHQNDFVAAAKTDRIFHEQAVR